MGKGKFVVTFELLADALHLPVGTKILGVKGTQFPPHACNVIVENPNIPEIPERDRAIVNGIEVPQGFLLNPTFTTDYDGGKTEYAVKLVSWG